MLCPLPTGTAGERLQGGSLPSTTSLQQQDLYQNVCMSHQNQGKNQSELHPSNQSDLLHDDGFTDLGGVKPEVFTKGKSPVFIESIKP